MRKFVLLLMMLSIAICAVAQEKVYTPKPGSEKRKAIMETLREPVEKELKQKVKFKIDSLNVQADWAFMRSTPQQEDGKPIDYSETAYQEYIKEGVFDDGICALLQRKDKEWKVVTYVIGSTDVPYVSWDKDYKAPAALLH
jgi:hypothetical protein